MQDDDAVRLTTSGIKVMWIKENSPWAKANYGGIEEPIEPPGGVPGEPGGAGGFGGPPAGSGFGRLQDPFTAQNFLVEDGAPGSNRTMRLRLVSNVSEWTNDYALVETASNSWIFADAEDSLAVRLVLDQTREGSQKGTVRQTVLMASMAFGSQRMMTLYQKPGTNTYESERLTLAMQMPQTPSADAVDTVTVTVASSLLPGVTDTGVLVETGTNSLTFERADGKLRVQFTRWTAGSSTNRADVTALVTSDALEAPGLMVDAIETSTNTLSFSTAALHNSGGPGSGPGATRYVAIGSLWVPVCAVPLKNGQPDFPPYWTGTTLPCEVLRMRPVGNEIYPAPLSWSKAASIPAPQGCPPTGANYYTLEPLRVFVIREGDTPAFSPQVSLTPYPPVVPDSSAALVFSSGSRQSRSLASYPRQEGSSARQSQFYR